jgi:hypothetical protein
MLLHHHIDGAGVIGLDPTFVSPGAISARITWFGWGFSGIKFSVRARLTKHYVFGHAIRAGENLRLNR